MNSDFYKAPPTFREYAKKLMQLKHMFPFGRLFSIGKSVLRRPILGFGIGNMKNAVLLAGAFHAQEWLTATLLVRFLEELLFAVSRHSDIDGIIFNEQLAKRGVIFVPMVNPDGVSIALEGIKSAGAMAGFVEQAMQASVKSWQANARGVDLNHNFDAGFYELKQIEVQNGITAPCPRQYGGAEPHSEPESRAIVKLCQQHTFDAVYAFHSQGEEIFYEYGESTPPNSRYIAELLALLSGYTLVKNDGLCSHGGFKDYFIQKYKKPGFTIEIGKGENPLPIENLESIYDRLRETISVMIVM